MDTLQRQSIDQNLRKLAEAEGFSDIYAQDYSGYFKDLKRRSLLNWQKLMTTRYITKNFF